ncbi:PXA domain-containing protein [Neohortaea acidophila]|uniref:PXA domain-containing protein n=1 Tax=Neohortaea acidophila TaxID=245834 RepID=A0A6A6Q421_9PEZI|nr:PXA domain-containing protein [Neohortaea acidophila]KAF2487150.1 PXA domain-containing protein [Neohortaea acidophila]
MEVRDDGSIHGDDFSDAQTEPLRKSEGGPRQSQHISGTLQGLTDKALHFLSHASNETLGACLVGLGASTYFVFGRVGLLIIGVAGGVVLQATWEGARGDHRDEQTKTAERERRREAGVEVARRLLEWRSNRPAEDNMDDIKVYPTHQLDYSAFEPKTARALTTFTDHVIKDYVHYWYDWSLPGEPTFPASCRRTFTAFVLSLSTHLQRKRPADAFLDFVTNASSIIIVFLNELAAALHASPNSTPSEAITAYLDLKPDSNLSYLLNPEAQDAKLKDAAEDILQNYVDPKAYNFPPARLFLKEVMAQLILGYTVTMCSKPEWINEWIVYLLEESKTTEKVMNIVDASVKGREDVPAQRDAHQDGPQMTGEDSRKFSRAGEAMDDALQEAKRLTQMMIEEDERRTRESQDVHVNSSEDVSDVSHTQGAPTPTSSQSDREEIVASPAEQTLSTPASTVDVAADDLERPSTPHAVQPKPQFTSFDQLIPSPQPTALSGWSSSNPLPTPPIQSALTLLNASMSIFDDSVPGEKALIKAKPQIDYLIQIEPASSAFPGWMIARKYTDFETLHEVLRRISVITGVTGFVEKHTELPKWKGCTKAQLRQDLEAYLTHAVKYQPLAESEGMKRFLEKDLGLSKVPAGKSAGGGKGWKLGDDMISALSKAPKQVAGGGKAVLGGVAGGGMAVLGGVAGLVNAAGTATAGVKKQSVVSRPSMGSLSDSPHKSQPSAMSVNGYADGDQSARQSQESFRTQSSRPGLDRHVSTSSITSVDTNTRPLPPIPDAANEDAETDTASPSASLASPSRESLGAVLNLPPPPSEMPADYNTAMKADSTLHADSPKRSLEGTDLQPPTMPPRPQPTQPEHKPKEPLSDAETSVAVELMFAVITELYTLSSAWNFRRTLLTAAKTFLLRPGNPQRAAIRDLLQASALDSNLSDAGLAAHIYKLRENALPTADELEKWKVEYPEKSEEEKEALRVKARKLLVQKGMPAALQSVMGAAASGEAMGNVFDCLQVESVSRGLIFGLLLQGLRVVTH